MVVAGAYWGELGDVGSFAGEYLVVEMAGVEDKWHAESASLVSVSHLSQHGSDERNKVSSDLI